MKKTILILSLIFNLSACKTDAEPEPTISTETSEYQAQAIEVEKNAETSQKRIMEETSTRLPITPGPNTIDVTSDLNDLDKQIQSGD